MQPGIATVVSLAFGLVVLAAPRTASAQELPIAELDHVFERRGQQLPDSVYKFSWPRSDIKLEVGGAPMPSQLALVSWAGFMPSKGGAVVAMGDLALRELEVDSVVRELKVYGVAVTAIHNHLLGESPRIIYVHFMGSGPAADVAAGIKAALQRTTTPLQPAAAVAAATPAPKWTDDLVHALGYYGKLNGEVLGVSVPRADQIRMGDAEIPAAMGLANSMSFTMARGEVASTGDLVLIASEVNPVIAALQQHHIAVTAVHSHMLDDTPHLFFIHYWALGSPAEVGAGLKAALAQVHVAPPAAH
jgi:hypothetical protein